VHKNGRWYFCCQSFLHWNSCRSEIRRSQGCQIFLDTIYHNGGEYTKLQLNHNMAIKCNKWPFYVSNDHRVYLPFTFQGPPELPKLGFLVWLYTIWQTRTVSNSPARFRPHESPNLTFEKESFLFVSTEKKTSKINFHS
jgi:hypothetical protein